MENPDKKSSLANKVFYTILVLLILGSIVATFYRIVIIKDYQIVAETSCDTSTEQCYEWLDEETGEVSYYKLISKKAADIVACEATEEKIGCDEELTCTESDTNCSYTYCDPDNLEEGEVCAVVEDQSGPDNVVDGVDEPTVEGVQI